MNWNDFRIEHPRDKGFYYVAIVWKGVGQVAIASWGLHHHTEDDYIKRPRDYFERQPYGWSKFQSMEGEEIRDPTDVLYWLDKPRLPSGICEAKS